MISIVTTDLHLTNKGKDEHRFKIFDYVIKAVKKHDAHRIIILGDITDAKDAHPSPLVNRIVDGITRMSEVAEVVILMGNHDYLVDPTKPFFKFLSKLDRVRFITEPTMLDGMFFVPHTRSLEDWKALKPPSKPNVAFVHQCVTGAISESGHRLDGFPMKPLRRFKCPVWAGDIHRPHKVGVVEYVGPPYHIRFGDDFVPRCIALNEKTGKAEDLKFKFPKKWSLTISNPEELENTNYLREGDQVKITLDVAPEEAVEWPNLKRRIVELVAKLGLVSFGVELKVEKAVKRDRDEERSEPVKTKSPGEVLAGYCKREKIPRNIKREGKRILAL